MLHTKVQTFTAASPSSATITNESKRSARCTAALSAHTAAASASLGVEKHGISVRLHKYFFIFLMFDKNFSEALLRTSGSAKALHLFQAICEALVECLGMSRLWHLLLR